MNWKKKKMNGRWNVEQEKNNFENNWSAAASVRLWYKNSWQLALTGFCGFEGFWSRKTTPSLFMLCKRIFKTSKQVSIIFFSLRLVCAQQHEADRCPFFEFLYSQLITYCLHWIVQLKALNLESALAEKKESTTQNWIRTRRRKWKRIVHRPTDARM